MKGVNTWSCWIYIDINWLQLVTSCFLQFKANVVLFFCCDQILYIWSDYRFCNKCDATHYHIGIGLHQFTSRMERNLCGKMNRQLQSNGRVTDPQLITNSVCLMVEIWYLCRMVHSTLLTLESAWWLLMAWCLFRAGASANPMLTLLHIRSTPTYIMTCLLCHYVHGVLFFFNLVYW